MDRVRVIWSSERSIHIVLHAGDDAATMRQVHDVFRALQAANLSDVVDLTPASTSVCITFDPLANDMESLAAHASRIAQEALAHDTAAVRSRTVDIPVCYEMPFAPDLFDLASTAGLSVDDAIDLHTNAEYTVRFLGFSPGFPYLDGLPKQLHAPRLATPRPRLLAGSVGIAGNRTGIYPQATPGGWRIIGATPLSIFDASSESPALLNPGDTVRFRSITRNEFDAMHKTEG
jgi:KipI family sensor histidine kinase inhibitor